MYNLIRRVIRKLPGQSTSTRLSRTDIRGNIIGDLTLEAASNDEGSSVGDETVLPVGRVSLIHCICACICAQLCSLLSLGQAKLDDKIIESFLMS